MAVMDESTKTLLDRLPHSALWAGVLAAVWGAWKLVQLVFWSEDRVSRIAVKVLSSNEVQKTIKDLAKQVALEVTEEHRLAQARIEQRMAALEKRDEERAAAVTRAFQRIDDTDASVNDVYKLIATKAASGG